MELLELLELLALRVRRALRETRVFKGLLALPVQLVFRDLLVLQALRVFKVLPELLEPRVQLVRKVSLARLVHKDSKGYRVSKDLLVSREPRVP